MVTSTVITQPTIEPITVEEAKSALGIEHDDDDVRIEGYIQAGREFAEAFCDLRIMSQVVELSYDHWESSVIELDLSPIQSIDSVKYDDTSSPVAEVTLVVDTDYYADTTTDGGRVSSIGGWPSHAIKPNPIRIRATVGYVLPESVPFKLKEGIKAYVVYLYEQDCDMLDAVKRILWPAKRL